MVHSNNFKLFSWILFEFPCFNFNHCRHQIITLETIQTAITNLKSVYKIYENVIGPLNNFMIFKNILKVKFAIDYKQFLLLSSN